MTDDKEYIKSCRKYLWKFRIARLKNPKKWSYFTYLIKKEKLNIKISRIEEKIWKKFKETKNE